MTQVFGRDNRQLGEQGEIIVKHFSLFSAIIR